MLLRLMVLALGLGSIQGGTILVDPSTADIFVGQSFILNVNVDSLPDLYAYQFDLQFDPTVLRAFSVSEGSYLTSGGPTLFFPGTVDNVGGFVLSTADSLEGVAGVSGSGTLASFGFQAIAAGSTSITLQNIFLLDSSLSGITAAVSSGEVTVMQTPEPSYGPLVVVLGIIIVFVRRRSRVFSR